MSLIECIELHVKYRKCNGRRKGWVCIEGN